MDLSPAHPFSLFFANLIGSMPAEYMQESIQIFPIDSNEGMIAHIGPMTVSFFPEGRNWTAGITHNSKDESLTGSDPTTLAARIADWMPSTQAGGTTDKKGKINQAARDWLAGLIALSETGVLLLGLEIAPVLGNSEKWVVATMDDDPLVSGFARSYGSGAAWESDEAEGDDPAEIGGYTAFAFNAELWDRG